MKFVGVATLAVMGTLALSNSASAAVVCNEDSDCWRVKKAASGHEAHYFDSDNGRHSFGVGAALSCNNAGPGSRSFLSPARDFNCN